MEQLTYVAETLTTREAVAVGAIAGGIVGTIAVISVVLYIFTIIACWKIFQKAGEKGWKALIPIYNYYILFKIVHMKSWFWLLLCIGIIFGVITSIDQTTIIFTGNEAEIVAFDWASHPSTLVAALVYMGITIWAEILYAWRTSKVFGHGVGYFLGLFFLQPIFWLILGFGSSKYDKKRLKASK